MLLQMVGLPMNSDSLVYKLEVVTCERPFSSQELWVSTYPPVHNTLKTTPYVAPCISVLPSTILLWWLAMIPRWEGHACPSDGRKSPHTPPERGGRGVATFVAVYVYHTNFLFTCLLLGTVPTVSVSDILLNQKRFYLQVDSITA